ncbi:MAG: hypothetical protein S4CHLAM107_10410 [Chlamydiia bacterium]|nr:hypothetical protein [Chlamydiia bacterium]
MLSANAAGVILSRSACWPSIFDAKDCSALLFGLSAAHCFIWLTASSTDVGACGLNGVGPLPGTTPSVIAVIIFWRNGSAALNNVSKLLVLLLYAARTAC